MTYSWWCEEILGYCYLSCIWYDFWGNLTNLGLYQSFFLWFDWQIYSKLPHKLIPITIQIQNAPIRLILTQRLRPTPPFSNLQPKNQHQKHSTTVQRYNSYSASFKCLAWKQTKAERIHHPKINRVKTIAFAACRHLQNLDPDATTPISRVERKTSQTMPKVNVVQIRWNSSKT